MTWGYGKAILLGEHAVVYGHPALAGALGRGVRAAATTKPGPSTLTIADWKVAVLATDDHPVAEALRALCDAAGSGATGLAFTVRAGIPPAAGLGSSAALAVALARVLCPDASDDRIADIASAAERCFHGTPSGIDVALATRGGLGLFRRGTGLAPVAAEPIELAVGLTGEPRRTADMVARVREALSRTPAARDRIDALGDAARRGADALIAGDLAGLGALMNDAHDHLAALGVSSPGLDELVAAARDAGAAGAKLTGAGGGGAVLACAPGRVRQVCERWQSLGYDAFACRVGVTAPEPAAEDS
jgi:mevalonate kinase